MLRWPPACALHQTQFQLPSVQADTIPVIRFRTRHFFLCFSAGILTLRIGLPSSEHNESMLMCTGYHLKLNVRTASDRRPSTAVAATAAPAQTRWQRTLYRPVDVSQVGRWQHEVANHYRDYVHNRRVGRRPYNKPSSSYPLNVRRSATQANTSNTSTSPSSRTSSAMATRHVLAIPRFQFPRCVCPRQYNGD